MGETATDRREVDGGRPRVTVAIVAYQSGAFLQPCVDALAAQSYAGFEAIVVDNASTDGSVKALKLPDARFRVEPMGQNLGFAAANNVAARMARGEFLVTLNPDTRARPDWLAELVAAADRWPQAASVGSTQVSLADPTVLDGVGDVWHVAGVAWRARLGRPVAEIPPEGEVFAPCAAAALYRLAPFRELGGFDERFFCYCEDLDLGYRLRLDGWTAVQAPRAVVDHAGSGISGRTSAFTLFHGHRNRVWTYVKNTPGVWMWLLLPYHLAYDALMSYTSLRIGHGWTVARAHWAALTGIGPVLGDRRRVQKARKARAGQLFRAMAWSPKSPMRRDVAPRLAAPAK